MRKFQLFRRMVPGLIVLFLLVASCSDKEQPLEPPVEENPAVTSVSPIDGSVIGITGDTIRIEFSKPLDGSTVSDSTIMISPALAAEYRYDSLTRTVTLVPTAELEYGTLYTVTVTLEVLDSSGLSLSDEFTWSFRTYSVGALYVVPGGAGDGSREAPLGSIQSAVDKVADGLQAEVIYVASGEYHESVVIKAGVTIYGSRDPGNNWFPSEGDSTVVFGQAIDGHAVAMAIHNVSTALSLRNLTIIGGDATGPGEGSYGVCCANSPNVELRKCTVRSGDGAPGVAGVDGEAGADATDSSLAQGGEGGTGGYEQGGDYACDYAWWCLYICGTEYPPTDGEQGFCTDGSQTGGQGGTILSGAGEDGAPGSVGTDGLGGESAPTILLSGDVVLASIRDGGDGGNGGPGCGGGGGAGGGHSACGHSSAPVPGANGGNGGAGAGPGSGATGGTSGGSSIALVVYQSSVTLTNCSMISGLGGEGGDGGSGGPGGFGQPGGESWGDYDFFLNGGTGGKGKRNERFQDLRCGSCW